MGETEITIFIILATAILLIFISGIVVFVFRYRARKIAYEAEKSRMNEQHQLDLLRIQLESQRQTMQFIGQEIHDSVAQKLTLASIHTQRMEFETQAPVEQDKLAGVSKIINDSLLELRQLSKSLTDNTLQNAGLDELIRMECEQVNATGLCIASCEITNSPVIDIATKSSLFRIIQEFIQNSIKHSGCKEIKIRLTVAGNELAMTLADDGKGFDTVEEKHNGIGLDSIRRRIQQLGGNYNFESETGKGVRLNLTIPMNNTAKTKL